jgi:hypothetical protein
MDRSSANERSLSCHLALAACRDGHGNSHLINELMRTVYLAWYLQRAGYGNRPAEQFKIAEYAVENTLALAYETGGGDSILKYSTTSKRCSPCMTPSLQRHRFMRCWTPSNS